MKKRKLYLLYVLLLLIIIFSCKNSEENDIFENGGNWSRQVKSDDYYEILKNHIETKDLSNKIILLGYEIGWNKAQVKKHTDSLISKGIITPLQLQEVTFLKILKNSIEFDTIKTWSAYNYNFQLNADIMANGFINYSFRDNKLSNLKIFFNHSPNLSSAKELIARKYGSPKYETKILDEGMPPESLTIWLSGDKEIQVCDWFSCCYIQYSDLMIRYKEELEIFNSKIMEKHDDSVWQSHEKVKRTERENKSKQIHSNF